MAHRKQHSGKAIPMATHIKTEVSSFLEFSLKEEPIEGMTASTSSDIKEKQELTISFDDTTTAQGSVHCNYSASHKSHPNLDVIKHMFILVYTYTYT